MRVLPLLIAAAAIAPAASTARAPEAPAEALSPDLAAVQTHLRDVTTMTADFSQTDRNGNVLTGTLQIKRPGRVRFQYEKGVPLLVVGDGKALILIDYKVKQVSRWPVGNTPLGLVLDPSKDVSRYVRLLPSLDPQVVMISGQDSKHRENGSITVSFRRSAGAPGGLMLDGWSVLDAQNNRTTVRLTNQHLNGPIDDAAFRWTDPRPRGPQH